MTTEQPIHPLKEGYGAHVGSFQRSESLARRNRREEGGVRPDLRKRRHDMFRSAIGREPICDNRNLHAGQL